MSPMIKAKGPVQKSELLSESEDGASSLNKRDSVDGMVSVNDERAADMILKGKKELCRLVCGLDEIDYRISDIDEWECSSSGKNQYRCIAIAADKAAKNGEFSTALQALTAWAQDDDFPFKSGAGFIAEKMSGKREFSNALEFYDKELKI